MIAHIVMAQAPAQSVLRVRRLDATGLQGLGVPRTIVSSSSGKGESKLWRRDRLSVFEEFFGGFNEARTQE